MLHVALDLGNVIAEVDINRFVNKISEITGVSQHDAFFFMKHIQLMQDLGATNMAYGLEYRFKLSPEELNILLECWNACVVPNEMMLNFLDNLKFDGVKVAILSNMGQEHMEYLRNVSPRLFDKTIQHISCEVGARKPQKLFFQSFCNDHDEFTGCVYVDDLEENLKTGKKYGFKSCLFNLEQTLALPLSKQKSELDKIKRMIYNG